jgi:hypothetical protein
MVFCCLAVSNKTGTCFAHFYPWPRKLIALSLVVLEDATEFELGGVVVLSSTSARTHDEGIGGGGGKKSGEVEGTRNQGGIDEIGTVAAERRGREDDAEEMCWRKFRG